MKKLLAVVVGLAAGAFVFIRGARLRQEADLSHEATAG